MEKTIKLTKSGKIDMWGKIERKNKLTTEEKKLKAQQACKKYHENNKGAHNEAYKKYYEKNKVEINEKRKKRIAGTQFSKLTLAKLEKKLTKIWKIKGLII